MSRRLILGTAGHIDHGKTTLVRALTGTDTDRLPEEKERGITIDLGFAHLRLEDGTRFGIVDVPGHESFIRNMMAGASGIDLLLLVIAADEGVMPQTREHVAIAGFLGVRRAVVAVTKADVVEPAWLELVREEIEEFLAGTPLAGSPTVAVSGVSGQGLPALLEAIAASASTLGQRAEADLFRMPIDRVFTVRGTGTVVTGTVWSGRVAADATVRALPGGLDARVRGIQVHGDAVEEAAAGQRAALAVAADRMSLPRGTVLVSDDAWSATHMVTARLSLLPATDWVLQQRQRIRFHLGTTEVMGRVTLLEDDVLEPGARGWVQLRLESPAVARAGDRFVIRSYSPVTTIGGGVVAEPAASKRKRLDPSARPVLEAVLDGAPEDAIRLVIAAAGMAGVEERGLAMQTGRSPDTVASALAALGPDALSIGGRLFLATIVAELEQALLDAVATFHEQRPLEPGMERTELRRAAPANTAEALIEHAIDHHLQTGTLEAFDGRVALSGFEPELDEDQRRVRTLLLSTFTDADLAPPAIDQLPQPLRSRPDLPQLLRLLEHQREILPLTPQLYLARDPFERAVRRVRDALGGREGLSPTDFKTVLPVSRKYLIPLLELLDREGVTAREGAGRAVEAHSP